LFEQKIDYLKKALNEQTDKETTQLSELQTQKQELSGELR